MQAPSFWKIASRQFWPLFTLIFLLVAGGMLVGGLVTLQAEQKYELGGVKTVGRVTEKFTERRGSGKSRRLHYLLRYQFTTEDNYHVDGEDSVRQSTWDQFNVGDSVPVEYQRFEPEKNRIVGETQKTSGMALSSLGAAGVLVAGFFFWRSLSRVLTSRRLWEEGRRVDGTVDEVKETNVSFNRVKQWKIRYTYLDYAGRQHTGESDYLPPREAEGWHVGDKCVVHCDKDLPEISIWIGREESSR